MPKSTGTPDDQKDVVILLHGIAQNHWAMSGVKRRLHHAGYKVVNIGYPSTKLSLEELSAYLDRTLCDQGVWQTAQGKVHFVTHSMGGLVVRGYLDTYRDQIPLQKLGNVVMLAPPHGGSEIADLLCKLRLYKRVYGPAGLQLTTGHQEKCKADVYYNLGIIAGNKNWPYLIASRVMSGRGDGRVAVEKTKLNGMADHVTLCATHTFISWKSSVHKQIIFFLTYGKFNHVD